MFGDKISNFLNCYCMRFRFQNFHKHTGNKFYIHFLLNYIIFTKNQNQFVEQYPFLFEFRNGALSVHARCTDPYWLGPGTSATPWRKSHCLVHCMSKWVYVSPWRLLQDSLEVSLIRRIHWVDFVGLDLQSDTIFIFGAYDIAPYLLLLFLYNLRVNEILRACRLVCVKLLT